MVGGVHIGCARCSTEFKLPEAVYCSAMCLLMHGFPVKNRVSPSARASSREISSSVMSAIRRTEQRISSRFARCK